MVTATEDGQLSQYEAELTAGRDEIADVLTGAADGVRTGAIRVGSGADAVRLELPDELGLEIELEEADGELSLELELEWLAAAGGSVESTAVDESGDDQQDATLASAADGTGSLARFELFRDTADEWRWRLRHRNGNVIASSGEGYTRKANARKGLRSVFENVPAADVREESAE